MFYRVEVARIKMLRALINIESTDLTFWKRQNCRDREEVSDCQEMRGQRAAEGTLKNDVIVLQPGCHGSVKTLRNVSLKK